MENWFLHVELLNVWKVFTCTVKGKKLRKLLNVENISKAISISLQCLFSLKSWDGTSKETALILLRQSTQLSYTRDDVLLDLKGKQREDLLPAKVGVKVARRTINHSSWTRRENKSWGNILIEKLLNTTFLHIFSREIAFHPTIVLMVIFFNILK